MMLVQGRGEMTSLPAVTEVLKHHNAIDTENLCNVVITG